MHEAERLEIFHAGCQNLFHPRQFITGQSLRSALAYPLKLGCGASVDSKSVSDGYCFLGCCAV
jgi:hypothetical protein